MAKSRFQIHHKGELRHRMDIARDFVREQSCGEWDDDMIEADATSLADLLLRYREFGREEAVSDVSGKEGAF